jgi:ribonucleoside-diphosphate reductase alpha chain
MKIGRHFTKAGVDPYSYVEWRETSTVLKNESTGEIVYKVENAEVPAHFTQISQDIILSKYLRLTNVPSKTERVDEKTDDGRNIPMWLRRSVPAEGCTYGGETSAKQVFHRLAGFWTYWGWWYGYFDTEIDARSFYDESVYLLENQLTAPNTPQWYNSGVYWAYGLAGKKKGFWRADPKTLVAKQTDNAYQHPGLHACHILSVEDTLFEESGIYRNIPDEARAFVTGGGVGSNFSAIRSKYEKLSSGNEATGLMSFLKIFDRSAGVVKSGSSQRRAAKMVIVDMDHPEIPEYIEWKEVEERKVQALKHGGFNAGWEGEAYQTVSGQNSNNSIRIPLTFINAVVGNVDWAMTSRTSGETVRTMNARDLWNGLVKSAWASGDPGVQYEDTIQDWSTCPNDGRIKATNPCSEYVFLDDTSCNLATINLQRFFDDKGKLHVDDFRYTCRHLMMVLDISINAAQLPTKKLAEGTVKYRTTGLGHSGIGAVLMRLGIPYDSDKACHMMAGVTALMLGESYIASAQMARTLGTFPRYGDNKKSMARVLRNHCRAALGKYKTGDYEKLTVKPWEVDHSQISQEMSTAIRATWKSAISLGRRNGYRNAFTTLIQPSGTVGLLLGCDTTAIEPDFGIVKHKRLSGGGSMKIVNESVETALRKLGYNESEIDDIMVHVLGNNSLEGSPHINRQSLLERGVSERDIDEIEASLPSVTQLRYAVGLHKFTDESIHAIGLDRKKDANSNLFSKMGFTPDQYIEANKWICGYGTLEGAPHLKPEHLQIFDCANRSGYGDRYIRWEAHVRACSAVSPFISGAISKTFNMPKDATEKDVEAVYLAAFDGRHSKNYCPGGIKCFALYRDGCKESQPLNNPTEMDWWTQSEIEDKAYFRGDRRRPPKKRELVAHEVTIHGRERQHKVIIKFGEYEDGQLCEVWIDVSKENPDFYLAMKWTSRAMSNALQYGQPLREIAESFINEEGGPCGRTSHPYITYCYSIPDLVAKLAMLEYEGDTTYCRRTPAQHEVRRGILASRTNGNGNGGNSNGKYHSSEPILAQRSMITTAKGRGCSVCGSFDITRFPCETCNTCGHSLGGCSP